MTEEMLRQAARDSSRAFVEALEADFDPRAAYPPSPAFRRKLRSLRRRAEHPYAHAALRRAAMFLLVCLVSGGVFLSVDAEARDALRAWIRTAWCSTASRGRRLPRSSPAISLTGCRRGSRW